ncbi:nitronate monooxygenase [Nocardia amikacinitolerans]|uniref:Nitronate monooxygenase n=1 Tax=Nocardia amikacinitolerans TaxID=756689 RepID=A0A285M141_9NOCA|nr:nitronate monooxygenase [Nocardia amikacinitolerans]SNY89626.1 nitronate monooxygenase [Nocardia amikacinitolerans]
MGLRVPVVNAPMGGVAGGRLAAAVTAAGGLGMIGMGSAGSAAALRRELPYTESLDGRFGIGLVDWVVAAEPELLEVAIAAAPTLIAVSFGMDPSWIERVRAHGIRTATQVYNATEARRAGDAGIDVLVARGAEGGGHGAVEMATLPLLDAVLGAVTVPVLAAGGIGSPASLAAVLAAGASGAWLGTHLAACSESSLPEASRRAMLAADGTDTIATTAFDVAMRLPWPTRFPARVLRNDFATRWTGHEDALRTNEAAQAELAAAVAADDPRTAPVDAGQGVGQVTAVTPAAQVIDELCSGAAELLDRSFER